MTLQEDETRVIIDHQLQTAGWQADTQSLRHALGVRPVKGVDKAISEWPTETGPADYVFANRSLINAGICKVDPRYGGWEKERATTAIDRYGLNHLPQLREGRSMIDSLAELYAQSQKTPTASCKTSIKEKTKQLKAKMKKDQPFSAVALI